MTSCQRPGQWQQAIGFFKGIFRASLQPDVTSFNAVMSSCEKCGEWKQARSVFHDCRLCFHVSLLHTFSPWILKKKHKVVEAPACTLHAFANGGTGFSQQHSSSQTSARSLQLQCSSERLRKGRVMGGGFVPFWRYADRPNSSGRCSIQRSH